jgi:hypothetical protein
MAPKIPESDKDLSTALMEVGAEIAAMVKLPTMPDQEKLKAAQELRDALVSEIGQRGWNRALAHACGHRLDPVEVADAYHDEMVRQETADLKLMAVIRRRDIEALDEAVSLLDRETLLALDAMLIHLASSTTDRLGFVVKELIQAEQRLEQDEDEVIFCTCEMDDGMASCAKHEVGGDG